MPKDVGNEGMQLPPISERPQLAECIAVLDKIAYHSRPIVLYNWRYGPQGFGEAEVLARVLMEEHKKVYVMAIDETFFPDLYIGVALDKVAEFRAGHPIVVLPIHKDHRAPNPRNRPDDTPLVEKAKTAMEIGTFRLFSSQKAIEIFRGTLLRRNAVAKARAGENAAKRLVGLNTKDPEIPDTHPLLAAFNGFIDRGRRKIAIFSKVPAPRHAAKQIATETVHRIGLGISAEAIEADNVDQFRVLTEQQERAISHEAAMGRWNTNAEVGIPIDIADLREIANAHPERLDMTNLMRIAIDGNVNPADTQGNLKIVRNALETGRKIGILLRGDPIMLTTANAFQIRKAISTVRDGRVETDEDGAYFYLADALAKSPDALKWEEIADHVLGTGSKVIVYPDLSLKACEEPW